MNRLPPAFFKRSYLHIGILIGLLSCSSSNSPTQDEAATEATEEVAEVIQEPGENRLENQDYDQLKNLPCKEKGNITLSNFYRLTESDINRIDQESRYYGMLLENIYSFYRRIRICLGEEIYSPDQLDRFFDLGLGEYRNALRTDLMPLVEEEMTVVGVPFVTFAMENMIPEPTDKQYNGFTYQRIYNYYREEFRNLYFSYVLLKYYSSFEYEMRLYVGVATTLYQTSEEEVRRTENFEAFMTFRENRYSDPSWSNIQTLEYSSKLPQYSSFWMRRGIDGSAESLAKVQQKILELYDDEWKSDFDKELAGLPEIRYTEDNLIFLSEGRFGRDSLDLAPYHSKSDSGFVVPFKNGTSKYFENSEYYYYNIIGHSLGNGGLIVDQVQEYTQSFFLDLSTGIQTPLGPFLTDYSFSPDSHYLTATYNDHEGSGLVVFEFNEGVPIKRFQSGYLFTSIAPRWISNDEFTTPFEMEGAVLLKLSEE